MTRNDITGDSIANAKGSAEKCAQGWEGIFGKKEFVGEYSWTLENGTIISFRGDPNGYAEWTSFNEPAKDNTLCVACGETVEYKVAKKHDPIYCKHCGNHFSVYWGDEPTTVMALDFHDSLADEHDSRENEEWEAWTNA